MAIAALVLVACTDDGDGLRQRATFEAMPSATEYVEVTGTRTMLATRTDPTWTPPSPYKTYENLNAPFANQKNLTNKSIGVFFTKDGEAPLEGTFTYRVSDGSWHLTTEIETKTYQLYGFIPKEDAASASITANGTYSNGAILDIVGLKTLTPSDVCVIVGAKNGNSRTEDGGLTMGKFDVAAHATSKNAPSANYIFLLFDHIYSALRFRFTIDEEYAKLRTVKLRKLELIAYSNDEGGGVKAKFNARITLKANETGDSPIVGNITYTPDESSANVAPVALYEWDGVSADVVLSTSVPLNFMGSFVPGINTYFKLRSTYDVYDAKKTDLLLRQNCVAENTIDLREKFYSYLEIVGDEDKKAYSKRGHSYDYTINVKPTYLYVLAEPDLDNPSVTIN